METTDHGMSAVQAMELSEREDRTVRLEWSEALEADLLAECDDYADVDSVTEYWGGTAPECLEPGETATTWQVALVKGGE